MVRACDLLSLSETNLSAMKEHIEKIALGSDYEGTVEATLVSFHSEHPTLKAALYIHGYVDYFFQKHMARRFVDRGWSFHALDLRKYGRSIRPGQHPYYCRDMHEYYGEIDAAIDRISEHGVRRIVLIGHSTGGLLASLYMADGSRRERIDRLILNSPFFEFNTGWFNRKIAIPVAALWGRLRPYASVKNELSPFYFDSVYCGAKGEWDFDPAWKPREGVPLYFAWLDAVLRGQRRLKRGLNVRAPVLVMFSSRSSYGKAWSETFRSSDTVLDVGDIRRYASCLGDDVSLRSVEGGLHDLVLSAQPVRTRVLTIMTEWAEDRHV